MLTPSLPDAASLWAKLTRDASQQIVGWHSLVDHSADVAAVLLLLLEQPTINRRLAQAAERQNLDPVTCARLAALAFLHDIGKANRGFRSRVDVHAPPVGHIDQLAWIFKAAWGQAYAERLMAVLGLERMESWFADQQALELWDAVFAHHGRPWRGTVNAEAYWKAEPGSDPIADLAPMRQALDAWFPTAFEPGPPLPATAAFHHAFAGLLMLADWLASDTQFFPFAHGATPDRMAEAQPAAEVALRDIGLSVEVRRAALRAQPASFTRSFGVRPRPLQQDVVLPAAACVVLEAETGSGKTEAALWRFQQLFEAGAVDGVYFALPTRVAASQMFARVKQFRDRLFPAEHRPAVVLAVPGQVGADDAKGHSLPDFGFEWTDEPDAATQRARWAAEHPKRFLAAQIAVGTVDQVLLAAIATRHAHLRGTALLRHLLVVDEVHVSDRYMETLLESLLRGHVQAGGHALLLSATLGAGMHARLLGTSCPSLSDAEARPYPALSWLEGGRVRMRAMAASSGRAKSVTLRTAPLIDDAAAIAAAALRAAEAGAKVLVIRNTVGAAVATAQALEAAAGGTHPALFRVAEVPTLHHGRFAPADRQRLDAAVEAVLGKRSPQGARVVIGTQTLEQSLDLDADLLITDLCPVDVLLQRIGRLHRHQDRVRPAGFADPCVMVLTPPARDLLALLRKGQGRHGLGRVYDDARIIEATWQLLAAEPTWEIPAMNRHLVEQATHPERLEAIEAALRARDPAWIKVLNGTWATNISRIQQANSGLLDRGAPFSKFNIPDEERWSTRLGAKDLLVTFPSPAPGPFGVPVETIRLPHFLAGAAMEGDAVAELLSAAADGLTFRLGAGVFRYDRFGLRREPS